MSVLWNYCIESESEILSDADARLQGENERNKEMRRFCAVGQVATPIRRQGSFRGWKDFVTPCERGGFLEHCGDGAVFLLTKLDSAFDGGFIE
jgi:hypothetical protein